MERAERIRCHAYNLGCAEGRDNELWDQASGEIERRRHEMHGPSNSREVKQSAGNRGKKSWWNGAMEGLGALYAHCTEFQALLRFSWPSWKGAD